LRATSVWPMPLQTAVIDPEEIRFYQR